MKPNKTLVLCIVLAVSGWCRASIASSFRPIPLARLVDRSEMVVVATPVACTCHWTQIGASNRLVTDFTLQVDMTLRGGQHSGEDIVVRTLGGSDGDLALLVYGEAQLAIGQTSLLFLMRNRDGALHVLGMAQGHYPLHLDDDGDWMLLSSSGLDGINSLETSAVTSLSGRRLSEVPDLLESRGTVP